MATAPPRLVIAAITDIVRSNRDENDLLNTQLLAWLSKHSHCRKAF